MELNASIQRGIQESLSLEPSNAEQAAGIIGGTRLFESAQAVVTEGRSAEAGAAKTEARLTYLYQKLDAAEEHLKYGTTYPPATRYTATEMNGGRLKLLASGNRQDMLKLERKLHENLPIGSGNK